MGTEEIHTQTAEQVHGVAGYAVLAFPGHSIPKQYEGLVYSKWLRSLRFGNDYFRLIDSEAFYRAYHPYIHKILHCEDCVLAVAVLADDYDVALGFSVTRTNLLDYVHVHKDNRRVGIMKSLIPTGIDTFTHITKTWMSIWNNKYKDWKFNPFV